MYGLLYDIKCSAARALERVIGRVTVKDKRANSHNYLDCRAHDLKFRTDSVRVMNQFGLTRTPSIAFRHLPLNSARTGYATEGAFFISAQLSTDAVSALRKVWVLVKLWKQHNAQART